MLAGAGAEHQTMHTGSDVFFDQLFEDRDIHRSVRVERSLHCEIDACQIGYDGYPL